MEIYTNTMTASTPSFGMPVVAASPRVAALCAQQLVVHLRSCVVQVTQVVGGVGSSVAVENTDGHVCHLLLVDLIAGAEETHVSAGSGPTCPR